MMYDGYINKIAQRFESYTSEIEKEHNFELGTEFEIAICKILRRALPTKYGVCRGYVVSQDGQKAGDDIVVFDKHRFPLLRLIDQKDFGQKEWIPIEAAYAYLEIKNSFIMTGDDANFNKALEQAVAVKKLVETREKIDVTTALSPYLRMDLEVKRGSREYWPDRLNPFYTGIISYQVRKSRSSKAMSGEQVLRILNGRDLPDKHPIDLLVAGSDVVGIPLVEANTGGNDILDSPFSTEDTDIRIRSSPKQAFAIGYCSLAYALDTICLGNLPWPQLLIDSLKRVDK